MFLTSSPSSREAVMRRFLITTWVLMKYEAFCLALSLGATTDYKTA